MNPIQKLSTIPATLALAAVIGTLSVTCHAADDAMKLYTENCTKCHGEDGQAKTKMGEKLHMSSDFTDAKWQAKTSDEQIAKVIKEGVKDPENGKKRMRAFDDLSEADIKALTTLIRSLKK